MNLSYEQKSSSVVYKKFIMALLPLFLLFTIPLLFLFFLVKPSFKNLPPRPFSWPLIGTLCLSVTEKRLHVALINLARTYGPVNVSQIRIRRTNYSLRGRFVPHSVQVKGYIQESMVWADCTEYWNKVRKIWRTELFSNKMLEVQASVREEKVKELMGFLRRKEGEAVKLTDVVFGCIINLLSSVIFSKNVYDFDEKTDNEVGMKEIIRQLMVLAATPNLADFYPVFGRLDPQGLRRSTTEWVKKMNDSWADIVNERRTRRRANSKDPIRNNDFLDILIEADFTNPQIDSMLLEIFGPGSDTSTCTIEWAMAELLKNPEKLLKLKEELNSVIINNGNNCREVKESDLPNLPYLHACIKETLRLHPPVTLLLPHRATETFQVMNYAIPKNTELLVNTYAIGRDPKTWDDPLEFKPERFLNNNPEIDYQGNDFHYIPFGAGRRICPAVSMASRVTRLMIASLVNNFNWRLPNGMKSSDIDMTDMFSLVLVKTVPLCIIPREILSVSV